MSTYTPGHDSTVMKVESRTAPKGPHGERYLASGRSLGMRLFDSLGPTSGEEMHSRPYEYAGGSNARGRETPKAAVSPDPAMRAAPKTLG